MIRLLLVGCAVFVLPFVLIRGGMKCCGYKPTHEDLESLAFLCGFIIPIVVIFGGLGVMLLLDMVQHTS